MRYLLLLIILGLLSCQQRKKTVDEFMQADSSEHSQIDSLHPNLSEAERVATNPIFQEILDTDDQDSIIFEKFKSVDLSKIFLTKDFSYNGAIGTTYKRLKVHISKVLKSDKDSTLYRVTGKTNVNSNICSFTGELKIKSVFKNAKDTIDDDGPPSKVLGDIFGEFQFQEDTTNHMTGSGTMKGEFSIGWDIKNGQIVLGDVWYTYRRNVVSFSGVWTSYKTGRVQDICWSDNIAPCLPKDFNCSDGPDFIPCEKYANNGWESLRNLFHSNDEERKQATKVEKLKWWDYVTQKDYY
jgi:hypothetical protein